MSHEIVNKVNAMNVNLSSRRTARKRLRILMLTAAMAVAWHAGAPAGDVTYNLTNNGAYPASGTGVDLGTAVSDINANIEAGRGTVPKQSANVTIDVKANETASGVGSTFGHWVLDGASDASDYSLPFNGFNNVSINGGSAAGGQAVLNGSNTHMVLKVYHVANELDVRNLKVTGGNYNFTSGLSLPAGYNGEVGGGGMTLGGNGMVGDHTGPAKVTLNNVAAEGNRITVVSNNANNAFGGGILVNGHGLNGGAVAPNYTDVRFDNVDLMNNSINFTNTAGGGSIRGGGARVGYAGKFTYNGGKVIGNAVTLNNGDHAAGGGLSVDGGSQYESVSLSGVEFANNSVTINGSSGLGQPAVGRGGAFYYLGTYSGGQPTAIVFNGGTSFTDNFVQANTAFGAGDIIAYGGAVHFMIDNANAEFSSVNFSGNRAMSDDIAGGGAIMAERYVAATPAGNLKIVNSTFSGNSAEGSSQAYGGAVYAMAGTGHNFSGSRFEQNVASVSGTGHAAGGAVKLAEGNHVFNNVAFDANQAKATGMNAIASGGAVVLAGGNHTIRDTGFTNNSVEATSFGGVGMGGALELGPGSNTNIINGEFVDNRVRGDEGAMGGAIFLWGGNVTLQDSVMTGNVAASQYSTNNDKAKGGAIYVATNQAGVQPATVTLTASAGKETLVSGNRAGGYANGIHYGNPTGSSLVDGRLLINGDGKVSLLDPVTVDMRGGRNFTMIKSGTGDFAWDGKNTFTTVSGLSSIQLDSGTVILGDKFTARGENANGQSSNFEVLIKSGAKLEFSISRDQDLAMFDFANTGSRDFMVDNGTVLSTNSGREIISKTWKFAIATGPSEDQLKDARDNFKFVQEGNNVNILGLEVENGTLYAKVRFDSPFDTSGVNPKNALGALDSLLKAKDGTVVSDAEYAAILSNPYSSTPELYMDQTHIMVNTVDMVARSAVDYGARIPYRQRMRVPPTEIHYGGGSRYVEEYYEDEYYYEGGAYPSLSFCDDGSGPRVWGGYVGNLQRRDTGGGYQGYKVETHGFVVGFNYDFSANGTIGVYGGYSSGESKSRLSSSKVESDTGHLGIITRISPIDALPALSIYADGGYHFSYNDFHREIAGFRNDASFDQELWTGAVGLEYVYDGFGFTITPHLDGRYVNLEHHALKETGNSALSTYTDGTSKGSFNTRLGVEVSHDFQLACGVITPSLNVSWKHEFGDRQYWSNAYYVKDPGAIPFSMSSTLLDRDSADIAVALRSIYKTGATNIVGLNVSYNLNVSRRANVHSLYAGFDIGF